jgi:uncharacterized protein YqeY
MQIQKRVEDDLRKAMRERAEVARDTLRMLLADLKKRQIDENRDLSEDEEIAIFQKAVKMRQESIVPFEKGGREDLASRERAELAIVQGYLPQALSEEETKAALRAVLDELKVASKKDLGAAMKAVMARHKGRIDGKLAQKLLGEMLS